MVMPGATLLALRAHLLVDRAALRRDPEKPHVVGPRDWRLAVHEGLGAYWGF